MIFETVDQYNVDNVAWQSIPVIHNRLAEIIKSDATAYLVSDCGLL